MTIESASISTLTPTLPSVVFLDRDGTIIHDSDHIRRPEDVIILPGAAAAVARLNALGVPVVVVTNQSGIARGYFTEDDYRRVGARMEQLLAASGARLTASYHCPHLPEISGPCDCRKPGTGMFRAAAAEWSLDTSAALFVGDRWRDVAPAHELGGRAVLIDGERTPADDVSRALEAGIPTVASLELAMDLALPAAAGREEVADPIRLVLLASGSGSNVEAVIEHLRGLGAAANARVTAVASNRVEAGALDRARRRGVAAEHFDSRDPNALLTLLEREGVDLIALAGYLRLVPPDVVERYRGRILNVHPGPLPAYGGSGMYGARVHAAVLGAQERWTAATVHHVDEQFDHGRSLARWPVAVRAGDTPDSLAARVLTAEHFIFPRTIDIYAAQVRRIRVAERLTRRLTDR